MRRLVFIVVAGGVLTGCATTRRTEVFTGDVTGADIERARQDSTRARQTYDTLVARREVLSDSVALAAARQDSIRRAEALARAREDSIRAATQVAAANAAGNTSAATTPVPGGGEAALSEADMRIMTAQIYFATNSAHLTSASRALLRQKAEILQRNPTLTLNLTGHADARGPTDYNQRLSERRADAVKRFLVSLGIENDRLAGSGRGENVPAVEGIGPEVWSRNRRVEFEIT